MRGESGSQVALKRSLGPVVMTFYGLGTIIGAGIYVLLGSVADFAGEQLAWSFVLAGGIAFFTALSYSELAARIPYSAGATVYIDEAFGRRRLSITTGWMLVLTGVVSAATLVNGFVGYLNVFLRVDALLTVTLLVVALGAIAAWDIKTSAWVIFAVTVLEVLGLALVMLYAWQADPAPAADTRLELADTAVWSGVILGGFVAFYAFIGFEDMVNVVEEVKSPERNMPLAIMLAVGLSTLLYFGISHAALRVLPASVLGASDAPLATVMRAGGGDERLISAISLVAVLNGALVQIIMASRVLYGMARRHMAAQALGHINPTTRTPLTGTVLVSALVLLFALSLPLTRLAQLTSLIMLIIFVMVNAALVTLKRRRQDDFTGFSVPLSIPVIGGITAFALLLFQAGSTLAD